MGKGASDGCWILKDAGKKGFDHQLKLTGVAAVRIHSIELTAPRHHLIWF